MPLLPHFPSAIIKKNETEIDNAIFQLHYRLTAVMLIAAAALVTSKEHFGKPITCGPAPAGLSNGLLENYCWTRSTFSLIEETTGGGGDNSAYPGVETTSTGDPIFYHTYYQWVWLVLTLQAAMFYLPRYLWKKIEGGKIHCLANGLTDPLGDEDGKDDRRGILVKYVASTSTPRRRRNGKAFGLFACELLNFVNVVGQIFLVNSFLGGTFFDFGPRVLRYGFLEQEERNDTIKVLFPRVTKCLFHSFGPSGNVQTHDAICVLPLNIINEKIYLVLWFWLIVLAIPSGIVLLYRLVLIFVPSIRVLHFRYNGHCNIPRTKLNRVLRNKSISDWLLLDLLATNLDSRVFEKIIHDLDAW